jgi:hypothetical protein
LRPPNTKLFEDADRLETAAAWSARRGFPLATLPRTMDTMNSGMLPVEHGQDAYRCDCTTPISIECQWFVNGPDADAPVHDAAWAQWAEEKRRAILAGTVEWSGS